MILKKYLNLANVKELFINDRLSLVKQLVKASLLNLPFNNINSYGALIPNDRVAPTYGEILASLTRGDGGCCNYLNNHMKLQLESFGFQTELIGGCFRRTGLPLSHYLVKVKIPGYAAKDPDLKPTDPRPDKTYVVDVGCGVPIHEPIDLDKLPFYGTAAGLQYRYERVDDNTIRRVNECGDAIMGKKTPDFESPQDYVIDLTPRHFDEFHPSINYVYTHPRSSFFHYLVYCTRYLNISEDDFEMVCARGTDLIFITKETRRVEEYGSYENIKPSLLKYFPMINPQDIELTVKHFSMDFEEAIKIPSTKTK